MDSDPATVDTETCQGPGRCCALAPDLFDLDDFGMSSLEIVVK